MTPEQLKASILQYAIQGKLVEQREEEGTGEELYQQIQAEKQRLIQEKKIKKEKPLAEITEDEKPYDIPSNWIWVRFGELGSYKKGPFGSAITKSMFVPKGNGAIKVYEQKNAIQKDATIGDYYIRREYFESKMKGFEVFPGDIIVSCAGTIGETYVMPDDFEQGIINQALMRMKIFKPLYIPYFLMFFDFVLKKDAKSSSKGSAIKNIPPFEILKNYLVPLPPLAEQKRIVAKIEELLPLVNRYAVVYEKLEQFNAKFPEDMKKSILQYAIQGKLVEQRPEEGTGEELYRQIQAEKQRLIQEKKIKKEKPLAEISEDEIPFDIPESWKWCRLSDIIDVRDGTHDSPKYVPEGIPLVTSKNLSNGMIDYGNVKYITQEDADKINTRSMVEDNDILFAMIGSIGNPVLVRKEREFCIKNMALFKKYTNTDISMQYMYWFFFFVQYKLKKEASGGVQSFISLSRFREYLVPLPPFAEQKRIVAKIEELLPLCERLK
ncbi:MAG: restriction endonuclease subunit S [Clostridiales bacterium]|nr:restriction endonuclease subunit S [Clostridiales bacterium]